MHFFAEIWDHLILLAAWTILWISFNIVAKLLSRKFIVKRVKWLCNYLLYYQHFFLNKISTKSLLPARVKTTLPKSDFSHIVFLLFTFLFLYFFEHFKYSLSLYLLFPGIDFCLLYSMAPLYQALCPWIFYEFIMLSIEISHALCCENIVSFQLFRAGSLPVHLF